MKKDKPFEEGKCSKSTCNLDGAHVCCKHCLLDRERTGGSKNRYKTVKDGTISIHVASSP